MAEVRQILFNTEKKSISSKFDAVSNDLLNKSHWKMQDKTMGRTRQNLFNVDVQPLNYST
jgi:hypothetical protein